MKSMAALEGMVYDLVVIGSGMIGSAAAYHAAQIPGKSVCLIGPPEPKSREDRQIFGSWYDEGRMCRKVSDSHTWSVLAVQSMLKYNQLEKESGIDFFRETGFIFVVKNEEAAQETMSTAQRCGLQVQNISANWKQHFECLNLPDDAFVIWEKTGSGYVSARKLVKAHQKAAIENGLNLIPEVVSTIKPASSNSDSYRWEVMTEEGNLFYAKSVLVAAGAYAGFKQLFKYVAPNKVPLLDLRAQTVAFIKLPNEEVERLKCMPSIITRFSFDTLDGAYIIPPIQYPDGNWYLKLGHARAYEDKKQTLEEVSDWFKQRTGIPECVEKLSQYICHIIPGLKVMEVIGDGCITAHTPDYEPYIDVIAEGFGVALGGNGYAAKSCPEFGRLAARLVLLGEWNTEIPRDRVRIKWKEI
ncbi:N-methyl-L-tryptophan oxidase-like isoform X2 [Palaemon carinicauda]|uniref:N-methyl-L-tryptophan oxidase-like isoform X2 n=1 Tax=Palaemon carinicauda TaxID=392227 RepID=UPI0035B6A042